MVVQRLTEGEDTSDKDVVYCGADVKVGDGDKDVGNDTTSF